MAQFFNEEKIGNFKKILKENVKKIPNGDFELGDFTGYTVVNNNLNFWIVGSDQKYQGNFAAYITNNGSTANYTITSTQVSHFYIDLKVDRQFPKLRFKLRVRGEDNFDYVNVYVSDTIYKPLPGRLFQPLTSYANLLNISNVINFNTYELNLYNAVGKVVRVNFTWRNDASVGTQPPAIIDDIEFFNDPDQLIELEPSIVKIKGQIREFNSPIFLNTSINGLGGLDEGFLEPSTFYNIFLVYEFKDCFLVASKNKEPKGFSSFRLLGRFRTNIENSVEDIKYSYILDNYLENFEFFELNKDIFFNKLSNICVSNWSSFSVSTSSTNWTSLAYGKEKYVAVSARAGISSNKIIYSLDGLSWTVANQSYLNIDPFTSVIFANDLFVAIANSSNSNLNIATSVDGINWAAVPSPSARNWSSITFGNGIFVAVAKSGVGDRVMTSTTGFIWILRSTPVDNSWESVTYGKGFFVAVSSTGNNRVMISEDSINWRTVEGVPSSSWVSVTFGNGKFVAVANDGTDRIMVSENALEWQAITYPVLNNWTSVAYNPELDYFAAVSQGSSSDSIIVSKDGINWFPKFSSRNNHTFIASGDSEFLALDSTLGSLGYSKSFKIYNK